MDTAHEVLTEVTRQGRTLREAIPEVYAANAALSKAAMETEGELSPKVRELIALAIGVTKQCDGCVAAHARGAAKHGATAKEVAEMIGVTIMMNGGPATVWGPRAYAAFQEFAPPST
ncbi:MAG: carboxymuconolactone decarboxylase family protein [Mycobacteriales bacterium]